MKLSVRAQTKYVVSLKPTDTQLTHFIEKAGLDPNRFDYWYAIKTTGFRPSRYNKPIVDAFKYVNEYFANYVKDMGLSIEQAAYDPPYILYMLDLTPEAYKRISNMSEVRSVVQSNELIAPDDEPLLPEEVEKELDVWNPHKKAFLSKRAKSNYIEKKKEESGNITYIYSDKHVKQRNKKKVKRILQLSKSIKKLRKQVQEDLKDETLKPTAMVVALIDETYERIGNPSSAKENHFGVTTWRKKHISFSKGKAKIKYKGKAGVDQEKEITNSSLISDLKELLKDKKDNDEIFPDVSANKVNEYLKPFKITAKDIRGFHANEEMKKALKSSKSKEKDPQKRRKEEFKQALEETAKLVGHTPGTLKNQYLAPSLEESYMTSGKIQIKAKLSKRDIALSIIENLQVKN